LKSKRLCLGYKRLSVFVLSKEVDLIEPVTYDDNKGPIIVQGRWKKRKTQKQTLSDQPPSDYEIQGNDFIPSPRRTISGLAVGRQQWFQQFLYYFLPGELLGQQVPGSVKIRSWLLVLPSIHTTLPALESAIDALCLSKIGLVAQDTVLVRRGRVAYTKALGQLQNALYDPKKQLLDETLATCVVLSVLEVLQRGGGIAQGFIAHHNGALALLRARGPDACSTPLGYSLFLWIREHNVSQTSSICGK
jgi:hypothetical protein